MAADSGDKDRQAAAQGDGGGVQFAVAVRLVGEADAGSEGADQ